MKTEQPTYDALLKENEALKAKLEWCMSSPKQDQYDRALAMLRRMAGALEAIIDGEGGDPAACEVLTEYRKWKETK